jgi:hypothetical protein
MVSLTAWSSRREWQATKCESKVPSLPALITEQPDLSSRDYKAEIRQRPMCLGGA